MFIWPSIYRPGKKLIIANTLSIAYIPQSTDNYTLFELYTQYSDYFRK